MALHRVVVCCWLHGHQTELAMTKRQEEKLTSKIDKLKAVCPTCRDEELGNQPIFILDGETLFNPGKVYRCHRGHISRIGAFSNGVLNVTFSSDRKDFVNIEGTIEELKELIDKKEISCHRVKENGRRCDCKLKPMDDFRLSYPVVPGIKTRTRLGDLWDKAGVEPVRSGGYGKDGEYHGTRSEEANLERVRRLRQKRQIEESRKPGTTINQPTTTKYDKRPKGNADRLNGPK